MYARAFEHMNRRDGLDKYVTICEVEERRKIGIGSIGVLVQISAFVALHLSFLFLRASSNIQSASVMITVILIGVAAFVLLLLSGYYISWKFEKKHYFAMFGVSFFFNVALPFLQVVVFLMFLSLIASDLHINTFISRL